jgi:hypothetical protein
VPPSKESLGYALPLEQRPCWGGWGATARLEWKGVDDHKEKTEGHREHI